MTLTRYQPVWTADGHGTRTYFLCEVDLDDLGRLIAWREDTDVVAFGNTEAEMIANLSYMFADAVGWKSVALETLRLGMVFDPID